MFSRARGILVLTRGMMKLNVVILENMDDGFRGGYDWKQKDELDPSYKANER